MKAAFKTLLVVAIICAVGAIASAEEDKKKEVEYKGDLGCPKCTFKLDKAVHGGKCMNAIRYKEKKDGKEVTSYVVIIDNGKDEEYHKCSGVKPGVSVKGYVSKKKETKEQLYITPVKDGVKY